jgi:hypothetical protein
MNTSDPTTQLTSTLFLGFCQVEDKQIEGLASKETLMRTTINMLTSLDIHDDIKTNMNPIVYIYVYVSVEINC